MIKPKPGPATYGLTRVIKQLRDLHTTAHARLVGCEARLAEDDKYQDRLGVIDQVLIGRGGELQAIFMVFRTGSTEVLNSDWRTRCARRLSTLELTGHRLKWMRGGKWEYVS